MMLLGHAMIISKAYREWRNLRLLKYLKRNTKVNEYFPYKSHSIQPSQPRKLRTSPVSFILIIFIIYYFFILQYFLLLSVYSTLRMLSFTLLPCMLTFFYFLTHSIISYSIFTVLVYTSLRFFIPNFIS